MKRRIFVTGGSGYIGSRLIPVLLHRGHEVRAVVRSASKAKITSDCQIVVGNALEGASYAPHVDGCHTFIHLVGVSHPSPSKAQQFIDIDQRSALEAIRVAVASHIKHFIYVSIAHPAPVMKAYIQARQVCEGALLESGLTATVVRPWYVLGPGHWWPLVLKPFYLAAEGVPALREGATRLGLVSIRQMVNALAQLVDEPPEGVRIVPVPDIRNAARRSSLQSGI